MNYTPETLLALARRKDEAKALVQWLCARNQVPHIPPNALRFLTRLAKFCRYGTSCFHQDARIHAHLEGRREVFQMLIDYAALTPDELALVLGARLKPEETDE